MYISYTGRVICDLLAAQIAAEGMFISMGGGERHNRGCASEGWPVLRVFLVSRLSSPLSSRNLRVVEGEWPGRGPAWWAKV